MHSHTLPPPGENGREGGNVYEKLASIALCDVKPFALKYMMFPLIFFSREGYKGYNMPQLQ